MKGAVALEIKLELGNRCKVNMALFKNKNLGVSGMIDLCLELDAFAKFIRR